MSYIGSTPTTQTFISGTDYFNGNGSTTAFTLTRSVNSVNDIEVVVNNVVQQPNSAYNISGTTITFTSAPSSGTQNIYVRYLSTITQTTTPSQNTVSYSTWNSDLQNQSFAFKNRLINGTMAISQRGTSFTSLGNSGSTPQYCLDRWFGYRGSFAANEDISQQTGFNGFQYCLRMQRTSGTSSTTGMQITQIIETSNCYDLAGQNATFSLQLRAGANFSGGTVTLATAYATTANATSVQWSSGGTWTNLSSTNITPTTTGTAYSLTVSVPSNAQSLLVQITYTPSGTAGASDYIEFTGVQLEKGSTATSFDYRPYGTELALCQRYCYALVGANLPIGSGYNRSTSIAYIYGALPVAMRTAPSLTSSNSAGYFVLEYGTSGSALGATIPLYQASTTGYSVSISPATSITANSGSYLYTNNAATSVVFSAEL